MIVTFPETGGAVLSHAKMLGMILFYLGQAATFRQIHDQFGVSLARCHEILTAVIDLINIALNGYVSWRAEDEHDARAREWGLEARFGALYGVIGAVDGTLVPFSGRGEPFNPARWCSRKGFTSSNVLIVCDARRRILFICAGAGGSANDAQVYNWSNLAEQIPDGYFLLADAGYALR